MNLLIYTLRTVAGAIVSPPLVFVLVILTFLLYLKNKRTVAMQNMIIGGSVNSAIELTLSQLVLGIIGGTIGSVIISSLGIVFDQNSGIMFLFLLSMLLMFIKPRLICFSYSGAILGAMGILNTLINELISNFKYGTILNIDILSLMMFIGILHIIEGLLVMVDGDRGALPVFTNADGKIVGGYALKRYWVLPIAIMIALTMNNSATEYMATSIQTPNWWPVVNTKSILTLIGTSIISIIPFYAVLGYSSVTFTKSKKGKAISSGSYIIIYGVILILVAQLARIGIIGEIIVIIFAPIGHEFMLNIQEKKEHEEKPKYVSDEEGLVILEITSDSDIKDLGIEVGYKILSINNRSVNSEEEIYPILKESLYNVVLKVKDLNEVVREINFKHDKNKELGILLVPKSVNKDEILPLNNSSFKSVLDHLRNKSTKEEDSYNKHEDTEDKNHKNE